MMSYNLWMREFSVAAARMNLKYYCVILLSYSFRVIVSESTGQDINILFVNDLQYRFYPVEESNGQICKGDLEKSCVSGMARLSESLKTLACSKKEDGGPPREVLTLNAGNTLGQNSEWFDLLKLQYAANALETLNFTATAIGSEVLQYGKEAGTKFLSKLGRSACAANVHGKNDTKTPMTEKLSTSLTFNVSGNNVTIIGFFDTDGQRYKDVTGLEITSEIYAILKEVEERKSEGGKHIIIAMGYVRTLQAAKEIAQIKGVDIVIFSGGNLASADYKDSVHIEKIADKNSWVVSTLPPTGDEIHHLVGNLSIVLDKNGVISSVSCNGYDYGKSKRSVIKTTVDVEKEGLAALKAIETATLGISKVSVGGNESCNGKECFLGNLVTDAMLFAVNDANKPNIALWHSSNTVQPKEIKANESFTEQDIYKALGMEHDEGIYVVPMDEIQLGNVLEKSLTLRSKDDGKFLQVSGLFIQFDGSADEGDKVKSVRYVANDSTVKEMDRERGKNIIPVAVPSSFLVNSEFGDFSIAEDQGVTLATAVVNYIRRPGPGPNYLRVPPLGLRYQSVHFTIAKCLDNTTEGIILTMATTVFLIAIGLVGWFIIAPKIRRRRGSAAQLIQ